LLNSKKFASQIRQNKNPPVGEFRNKKTLKAFFQFFGGETVLKNVLRPTIFNGGWPALRDIRKAGGKLIKK
jgi:hypothetical protein